MRRSRAAENHVVTVAECGIFAHETDVLGNRKALARERCFSDLERGGLKDACVGGNDVPFIDKEEISANDLRRRNILSLAIAQNMRAWCGHLAQCGYSGRSA